MFWCKFKSYVALLSAVIAKNTVKWFENIDWHHLLQETIWRWFISEYLFSHNHNHSHVNRNMFVPCSFAGGRPKCFRWTFATDDLLDRLSRLGTLDLWPDSCFVYDVTFSLIPPHNENQSIKNTIIYNEPCVSFLSTIPLISLHLVFQDYYSTPVVFVYHLHLTQTIFVSMMNEKIHTTYTFRYGKVNSSLDIISNDFNKYNILTQHSLRLMYDMNCWSLSFASKIMRLF